MKSKSMIILVALLFVSMGATAALRFRWMQPVNQNGVADSYALPCEPITVNTSTSPVQALGEPGAVYWIEMDKAATAGDYIVLRDSATANTSSTALLTYANDSTTGGKMVQFNPPMAVSYGLSVNVSTTGTNATVCVRQADGGL